MLNKLFSLLEKHQDQTLLVLIYVLSTWFFRSRFLYNWDAGQFALGTARFSLAEHQPHPPGYFLFIHVAKWLNHLTGDVNASFLLMNAFAGGLACAFFYLTIKRLAKHSTTSFWLTFLLIVNPAAWFHRAVALTYTFEILAVAFLTFLLVRGQTSKQDQLPIAIGGMALLAGFRPSSVVMALPFFLALFIQSRSRGRALFWSIVAGLAGSLVWIPGFAYAVGGIRALFDFVLGQLRVASSTHVYNLNHARFFWQSVLYDAHLALVVVVMGWKIVTRFVQDKRLWVIPLAILWEIVFSLSVHFGEVGYSLSLIPLFLLLAVPVVDWGLAQERRLWRWGAIMALVGAVAVECVLFVAGIPGVQHHKLKQLAYRDIRRHDARIGAYLNKVRTYNPKEVVILVLRGQYLEPATRKAKPYPYDDIRLLSYYLPEYELHDMVGVPNIYWVAHDFRYTQHNTSTTRVATGKTKVLFLGDYVHPDMWPKEISLVPRFTTQDIENWYEADFLTSSFSYNGLTVRREAP